MAFQFNQGDRPLPGYTIQRAIGRGGFGEVYYALSDGGKEVALKYLRENPQVELRGVQHCLNLKSPHLVAIHDVKQNPGGDFFVIMEYVDGISLRDLLNQETRGLGAQKAAYFLREIGKGLSYLHDRGIVHRDLKPGNIFYEDGYVKIGDYGLSKLMAASQHSGQTVSVGTVHYMAPEVGSGNYDRTIDIYAMGVMLYEMLLGRVPFSGASMGEVLMKHLTAQPEVDELPAPFPDVIRKALAKDPRDRYQAIEQMLSDTFAVEDLDRSVAAFEPNSLSTLAQRAAAKVRTAEQGVPAFGTGSSNVGVLLTPPPIVLPDAARGPASPPPPPADNDATDGRLLGSRAAVLGATAATAAAAITATVINQPPGDEFGYGLGIFLHGMSFVAGVWLWRRWTGHYRKLLEDLTGTLSFAAITGILFLLANRLSIQADLVPSHARSWVLPMLAAFIICDWRGRLADGGRGIISIGPALWVALFGFIVGHFGDRDDWVPISAMLAGASLSTQMLGMLWPAKRRAKRSKGAAPEHPVANPAQRLFGDGEPVRAPHAAVAVSRDGPDFAAQAGARSAQAYYGNASAGAPLLIPRAPGARLAWSLLAGFFLTAATLAYAVPSAAGAGDDDIGIGVAIGLIFTSAFLFAAITAIPRYRHGLWRGVLRQAVFFAGVACTSTAGASMGLFNLNEMETAFAMALVIIGGMLSLFVWFIPVPAYQPALAHAAANRDRAPGYWLRVAGLSLLGCGVLLLPILLATLSAHEYDEVLPAVLIPIAVVGVCLTVASFYMRRANATGDRGRPRLELPIRRDFRAATVERLEANLERHAVIYDYTLRRSGDLIWSYQRGDWMSHLIQSDVRKWKTTFTVAVYDLPEGGYRISCLLDLDAPWNKPDKSMLRKLDEELTMLGETIGAETMSRIPAEVVA